MILTWTILIKIHTVCKSINTFLLSQSWCLFFSGQLNLYIYLTPVKCMIIKFRCTVMYYSKGFHSWPSATRVRATILEMNIVVWTRISAVRSQIDWKQISYSWRRNNALVICLCRVLRILCPVLVWLLSLWWISECTWLSSWLNWTEI